MAGPIQWGKDALGFTLGVALVTGVTAVAVGFGLEIADMIDKEEGAFADKAILGDGGAVDEVSTSVSDSISDAGKSLGEWIETHPDNAIANILQGVSQAASWTWNLLTDNAITNGIGEYFAKDGTWGNTVLDKVETEYGIAKEDPLGAAVVAGAGAGLAEAGRRTAAPERVASGAASVVRGTADATRNVASRGKSYADSALKSRLDAARAQHGKG
tara:strand:- start:154 stop:798 length:645 start_codon:yes stop_codon:yes gene_type:complete